jgi:hypothetical protein
MKSTSSAFVCVVALVAALPACTWSSESGTVNERYVSSATYTKADEVFWNGEPIRINNVSGNLEIVGVPGLRKVELEARPYAGAQNQDDADAAFADVVEGIRIEWVALAEPNTYELVVECPNAAETHGSADRATTGCDELIVKVPSGTAAAPLRLSGRANFGGIHATGLVGEVTLTAPFGIAAAIVPTKGGRVSLVNDDLILGNCPVTLALPVDFSADGLVMSVKTGLGEIVTDDFPGLTSETCEVDGRSRPCLDETRGQLGQGASFIEAHSSIGDAVLLAMDASGQPSEPLPWDRGGCADKSYEATVDVGP